MNLKGIIFDWSGTVVDDIPPVLEATNAVLEHCGRPTMTREEFRGTFRLPYTEFYEEHTPGYALAELETVFRAAFAASQAPVTLLPHARDFLAYSQDCGLEHIVLSSAPQLAVEAQARDLDIHQFFKSFHAGVIDKRKVIHALLEEHGWSAEDTLYLGDMVHDVETAHHASVPCVALLTGYDREPQLRAARPHHVALDLGEFLATLGKWLGRH